MKETRSSELKTVGRLTGIMVKVTALVHSGSILEVFSDSYLKRDSLPEPYDIADHIGNFKEGSLLTSAACALIGMVACINARLDGNAEEFKKRAKLTAAGAFVASSFVQVIGEKYGISNVIGGGNTPDMIDAAYGAAWSGVTAAAAYKYAVNTDERLRIASDERLVEWSKWLDADMDTSIAEAPTQAHDTHL